MPIFTVSPPKIVVVPASDESAAELASPSTQPTPRALRPRRGSATARAGAAGGAASAPSTQWLAPPRRRRRAGSLALERARFEGQATLTRSSSPPTQPSMALLAKPPSPTDLDLLPMVLERLGAMPQVQQVALWPTEQQQVLQQFLGRLLSSETARNKGTCQGLHLRLRRLLSNACRLQAFRFRALKDMQHALATYGDRTIRGLDDIELSLSLEQTNAMTVPEATLSLALLGISVMRLHIVRALAAQTSDRLPQVAGTEIEFCYEAHLRERLGLPGLTLAPKEAIVLPKESLEAAAQVAEDLSANVESKRVFFERWVPWLQLRRRRQAEAHSFAKLRALDHRPARPQGICPLTQQTEHSLGQPAYLDRGDQVRVFEYDALITWWIAVGTEPGTEDQLALRELRRTAP